MSASGASTTCTVAYKMSAFEQMHRRLRRRGDDPDDLLPQDHCGRQRLSVKVANFRATTISAAKVAEAVDDGSTPASATYACSLCTEGGEIDLAAGLLGAPQAD